MTARILHLVEQEGTPVTAALNAELWELIKLDTEPVPVLFREYQSDWTTGCCSPNDLTESGEIEVHKALQHQTWERTLPMAKRDLVAVYLHELAHRLTPDHGHDAVFATVDFALLIRAMPAHHILALKALKLYDFQDHIKSHEVSLADAAAFVMEHGPALADSDLPVSALAAEAEARFARFRAELAEVKAQPQREAALLDQVEDLKRELRMANQLRHMAMVGVVIVTALAVVLRFH
ncbi:hypothetical protein HUX88_31640 [Duganella sp. BJB1802]|uniref:hypothetical protein n=1 Tax=Duganella sp. BJB1802 TaxID=2744575 RepID=UPI0015942B66|nr:hypothetical protein [Duganella sp. BJB1802]NVD75035.1 hypothetical protein [Duganella sp. BJB1802]